MCLSTAGRFGWPCDLRRTIGGVGTVAIAVVTGEGKGEGEEGERGPGGGGGNVWFSPGS